MDRGRRQSTYGLLHTIALPSDLTLYRGKLEHNYSTARSVRIEINLHGQLSRRLGGWRTSRHMPGRSRTDNSMFASAFWDHLTLHGFGGRWNVGRFSISLKPCTDTTTQFRL